MLVNTISDVNELVSVFGLFTPSGDGLDATNKLIWVGGKLSEVFQENKVSFGAGSLTLTKFDDDFKAAYLARVKALKYPTTFPGSYLDAAQLPVTVVAGDMPPVVAIVLAALPVSDRLATVQKLISDTQIVAPPVLGFDGSYKGIVETVGMSSFNPSCWRSDSFQVTVSGSTLGGDLTGTVNGDRISATYLSKGLTFTGTIRSDTSSVAVMDGVWNDPNSTCNGTFSLRRS